jgi:formate hydrogenlyase subunit 6/NADH:ubiquinone oxidoreductase subunit I
MSSPSPRVADQFTLDKRGLDQLIRVLSSHGYHVIGPTLREGGIAYEDVASTADLPVGLRDEQGAGTYRLIQRGDSTLFGYNAGPQSWKKFLHPASLRLWRARRFNGGQASGPGKGFERVEDQPAPERFAFIGVRPCDLHAIAVQDRVFLQGAIVEPGYKSRREGVFILAVNCTRAGSNCFCSSMGTGPRATSGFDLALTEVLEGENHYFVVEIGTEAGASILAEVPHTEASDGAKSLAARAVEKAAGEMGHSLDTTGLKETLYRGYDSPQWGEVAERCLACSNCTMVCPTCFCTTIEDVTDLTGEHAERWRKWDSCYTLDFSYIHGGSIRSSISSRYRQWLVHKLATWVDQFGTFGCVGCGRCIAWCPVGIDITEEARAIQNAERR